jgi:uncharacterized protein
LKKRIIGIDVARALAVIGMIIVNFKIVLGAEGQAWVKSIASIFDGKAAATFVVLAGVGLALMTNTAIRDNDLQKLKRARARIAKRAVFLFLVGLSYIVIWPADILHFYGVYMAITLLLLTRKPRQIFVVATLFILVFPLLLVFFDYEVGWNFETLEYAGFWTVTGFTRNLFINGFHPVIPWTSFMLFGYWLGKQDLHDNRFVRKILMGSSGVFVAIQVLSYGLIQLLGGGDPATTEELATLLGTSPMPPLPLYMANGVSIAFAVISACILLAQRFEHSWLIDTLKKTGQLALTFYVAHVILGMGIIEIIRPGIMGQFPIEFSVAYAIGFSILCMLFATIWAKYRKIGPLEWVMRKVTD